MATNTIYYCKRCLQRYEDGHCIGCGGSIERDLTTEEQMYQRAAMKVLRNHRAEFFAAVEVEKEKQDD